ncbi:hypothetical protein [Deinococcus indicus]|nr:hypothetical protein [Deinococcus indicus]
MPVFSTEPMGVILPAVRDRLLIIAASVFGARSAATSRAVGNAARR